MTKEFGCHFRVAAKSGRCNLRAMHTASRCLRWSEPFGAGGLLPALLALVMPLCAYAHQVPSLTVEALFTKDRAYTLRVSLDPRLFLSDQPSSLPPVPIEWFREQTPDQVKATWRQAAEYVREALELKFGDATTRITDCQFQPMDGATNQPLGPDTKEVHLLGEAKGTVPDGCDSFQIALSRNANVSMILLNSFDGEMERRPNVIFPGETSRAFVMKVAAPTPEPVTKPVIANAAPAASPESLSNTGRTWLLAIPALLLAVWLVIRLRRKA